MAQQWPKKPTREKSKAEAEGRIASSNQGAELWETYVNLEQAPEEIQLIIYARFGFPCEFTDLELKDLKRKFSLFTINFKVCSPKQT